VVAASAAVLAASTIAASRDDPLGGVSARATVGRLVPVPGGTNVIASQVDAWLDVRGDTGSATRRLLDDITRAMARAAAEHGCDFPVAEESYAPPVLFDQGLRSRLVAVLAEPPELATGAGHDAGVLATELPTAMLFVRNPTGVSHSPFETATDEDCRAGVDALTAVLAELAG
jgi:beta-ureidopropionase / N-carbamoyl-L-amino-acid hydrolase